ASGPAARRRRSRSLVFPASRGACRLGSIAPVLFSLHGFPLRARYETRARTPPAPDRSRPHASPVRVSDICGSTRCLSARAAPLLPSAGGVRSRPAAFSIDEEACLHRSRGEADSATCDDVVRADSGGSRQLSSAGRRNSVPCRAQRSRSGELQNHAWLLARG